MAARGDRPRIGQVADLAGVSATTVSHALNGRRPVSAATRKRILDAIEQLGYRPNVVARGLRAGRTMTIGLVIPDITNPFYPVLARGLQDVLGPAGYDEIVTNTNGERDLERLALDKMISRQVDGIAFAVFHTHPDDLRPVIDAGIPVVRLGGRQAQPGVDLVHSDDESSAAEATRHLLRTGYQQIAFVCGPAAEGPAAERVAGYRAALQEAGHAVDPDLIAYTEFSRAGGAAGVGGLLDLARPPDAVLCANDVMAIGALDAARERSLRVPDDLAVMGFDDIEAASLVSPQLTTMANPAREIGQACGRLLIDRISDAVGGDATEVIIPARLIRRQSA
ncbi:LacI family DNA-binding transcriptional regulator [Virgisporangium aurantiacum]|uniref:LacI family transcriptional regulator n=1 Tax=Virgisporangium aurantiacum TaxID=175570 RepID=A0A8J3ZH01_9ACTN|nr:LacI family DNA-binding transcriptional regulator [Virgisporangium aurantiacum]GIJ63962.1 LacI family transcriptional regulator [Virgisporangium aurantiacum]